MDQDYPFTDAGENHGICCGRVSTADNRYCLVSVEHSVTGGAVCDSLPGQLLFPVNAEAFMSGAGGDYNRSAQEDALTGFDPLDVSAQLRGINLCQLRLCAEARCAGLHLFPQKETVDSLVEAWVVINLGGLGHLPAWGHLFQHHCIQASAGGIQCGRIAARAAADHKYIIDMFHTNPPLGERGQRKQNAHPMLFL